MRHGVYNKPEMPLAPCLVNTMQLSPEGSESSTAGTIEALSQGVYESINAKGYSLLLDDVRSAIIDEVAYLSGWATLECQRQSTAPITLDSAVTLSAEEWSIIRATCFASIDLKQAQLVESVGSMGSERYGLDVNTANALWKEERDRVPQLAFNALPWSIDTDEHPD